MLRFEIPDWVWGFLFGIVVTSFVAAVTFKYLPSPLEMFGDVAAECRKTATESREQAAQENAAQPGNLKTETEYEKAINECLVARYTGSLANFTRWLVAVTLLLALFGFWQVIISRRTARRQQRAYVNVEPLGINPFSGGNSILY
jgi:hypothetical protein